MLKDSFIENLNLYGHGKTVLKLHFQGKKNAEIGEVMNITPHRIAQILKSAKDLLWLELIQLANNHADINNIKAENLLLKSENKWYKELVEKSIAALSNKPNADVILSHNDFTGRVANFLRSNDINTVRELSELKITDLYKMRNLGKKSVMEIKDYLQERHNIRLQYS